MKNILKTILEAWLASLLVINVMIGLALKGDVSAWWIILPGIWLGYGVYKSLTKVK